MKLLDKRKIDTAIANQRKTEIDNGIKLAMSVDNLRRAKVQEEQNLKEYRERAFKEIQIEIDSLLEDKSNLLKWNTEARSERIELLKPLDEEWTKLNNDKVQFEKKKESLRKIEESVIQIKKKSQIELGKVSKLARELEDSKNKVEKTQKEANELRDLAQKEYEMAKHEREIQTGQYEKAMFEANSRKIEYEIGLKTQDIETRLVKEKESELISDRKHLETQIRTFNIARGIIKNGTSQPNNTER